MQCCNRSPRVIARGRPGICLLAHYDTSPVLNTPSSIHIHFSSLRKETPSRHQPHWFDRIHVDSVSPNENRQRSYERSFALQGIDLTARKNIMHLPNPYQTDKARPRLPSNAFAQKC